ncbi:MAG: MaoC/PaaZ C-terminal domain-containing protein [Devosia sp.]
MERHWEDYAVGEQWTTSGRTLSDADIKLFIGATDATHPAHVDSEYAKKHPFGAIVVPGSLTVGVVDGLVVQNLVGRKVQIGHYGYDRIRFLAPVFLGDTISVIAEVVETRERNAEFGLVVFDLRVMNQHGKQVAAIRDIQMVERVRT